MTESESNPAPDPSPAPAAPPASPLPSIGQLFSESKALYKTKAGGILGVLFTGIFMTVLAVLALGLLSIPVMKLPDTTKLPVSLAVSFLSIVGFAYLFGRTQLAMVAVAANGLGRKEAWGGAAKHALPFLWMTGLGAMLVMGGFLFFFVPGVVFSVWFAFAPYAFAVEGVKGFGALLRSRELVRGRWFPVAGRLLVVGFLGVVVSCIPVIGPFLNLLFMMPLTMIYTSLVFFGLAERPSPAVSSGRSKAAILAVGLLGFMIIPALFVFLFAAALRNFAEKAQAGGFPKVSLPGLPQLAPSSEKEASAGKAEPAPSGGASSPESLLQAARAALTEQDADAFLNLYAPEMSPVDRVRVKMAANSLIASGISRVSTSPADGAFAAKTQNGYKYAGTFDFYLGGEANGAFMPVVFGEKGGKYFLLVPRADDAEAETQAAVPAPAPAPDKPSALARAKSKLNVRKSSSSGNTTTFTHEVYLKNRQHLSCEIVERDAKGIWVEIAPGSRAYFAHDEILKIEEMGDSRMTEVEYEA